MTTCPHCNQPIDQICDLCPTCGGVLTEPPVPAKKRGKKALLISLIAAFTAVAVAVVLFFTVFCGGNYPPLKHSVSYVDLGNGQALLVFDDQPVPVDAVQYPYSHLSYAPSQQAVLYIDNDDTLYYIEAEKKQKIAENVDRAEFSEDSRSFYYYHSEVLDPNFFHMTFTYDVYFCEVGDFSPAHLVTAATDFVFSPDQSRCLYTKDDIVYYWENGDVTQTDLDPDYEYFCFSNNGTYLYSCFYAGTGPTDSPRYTLYVQEGIDGEKLQLSETDSFDSYTFNRDRSEILFESRSTLYLSVDGRAATKIIDRTLYSASLLLPKECSKFAETLIGAPYTFEYSGGCIVQENLFIPGMSADQTVILSENISSPILSQNGKTLLFIQDNALYRVDLSNNNDKRPLIINSDVSSVSASTDCKSIYFLMADKKLYFLDNGQPVNIASNVTEYEAGIHGGCFFGTDDGWYYVEDGDTAQKIDGPSAGGTLTVRAAHVIIETDTAVYLSDGDGDFEKIADKNP